MVTAVIALIILVISVFSIRSYARKLAYTGNGSKEDAEKKEKASDKKLQSRRQYDRCPE